MNMITEKDNAFAALVAYRKWCSDWVKWETSTSILVPIPFQVPFEAWEAMSESNSSLYDGVHDLLSEKGVAGLSSMVNKYFHPYFELLKLKKDGKADEANAVEGLRTGNTFLQNVSDIALQYNIDGVTIAKITGKTPMGWGDRVSPEDIIQGCQTGNDTATSGNDGGVCKSDKNHKNGSRRKRGRPMVPFKDLMIDDTDGRKLNKVHILMNGRKGKSAALVIVSCVLKGWMIMPKFKQVQDEFGDVGVRSGFTKYLHKTKFTEEEIEGVMKNLVLDS